MKRTVVMKDDGKDGNILQYWLVHSSFLVQLTHINALDGSRVSRGYNEFELRTPEDDREDCACVVWSVNTFTELNSEQ